MALPQKGKCHCNIWRVVMPFDFTNYEYFIVKDKATSFDLDVAVSKEMVKDLAPGGNDVPWEYEDMDFEDFLVRITLRVTIYFEKSGSFCHSITYPLGFPRRPKSCRYETIRKMFAHDLYMIYKIAKTKEEIELFFSARNHSKLDLQRTTASHGCSSDVQIGCDYSDKDCDMPYLVMNNTGYYLTKSDIMALGEWLYEHSK